MQAIILAAGTSTRTYPLTVLKPKPLLKAGGKTIIEHNLEQLQGLVKEVIIVVGFGEDQIRKKLKGSFGKIKIKYARQLKPNGTGDALLAAKKLVTGKFILLMGDNFYSKEDIEGCLKHDYCILGKKVKNFKEFGVLIAKGNKITRIVEKPSRKISDIANTGLYVFQPTVFEYLSNVKKSSRGEYELTDIIQLLARKEKIILRRVRDYWLPITYPWSLLDANKVLLSKIETDIKGVVEDHVTIKGAVIIGKDTLVKSGTYIQGPVVIGERCVIGPNCYIRQGTAIGNNCKVGNACDVKDSVIMDNSAVSHLCYVGDSVIGENVNLGASTITANLRHDHGIIKSIVKDTLVSTDREKFGAVIGDNVHTGIHTSIYPGRKIWPGKSTLPGEIVKKDII